MAAAFVAVALVGVDFVVFLGSAGSGWAFATRDRAGSDLVRDGVTAFGAALPLLAFAARFFPVVAHRVVVFPLWPKDHTEMNSRCYRVCGRCQATVRLSGRIAARGRYEHVVNQS